MADCERLQEIARAGSYIDKWVGSTTDPSSIYKNITEGDLPPLPDACRERYSFMAIYLKDTGAIVGYFDVYHGYPDAHTVWIGILLIDPAYQRQGYAQEVVEGIAQVTRDLGYTELGIGVHLKNWPALRFWVRQGFDRIVKVAGDAEHSEMTFAVVSLRRGL